MHIIWLGLLVSSSFYSHSSPAPSRLAMSGIGMLSASSSDFEKSTCDAGFSNPRLAMPPPPVKPKQLRRIVTNALPFNDSNNTPPSSGSTKECSFGRFPRGALVWSNGKPEQLQSSMQAPINRLDFNSPASLSILSPHSTNPTLTPLQQSSENQPQTSSAPLFNATNKRLSENTTPLKQQGEILGFS